MNDLNLSATQSTPKVVATLQGGVATLEMRGDSYPENPFEFFAPLVEWVEAALEPPATSLCVQLHLVYLNTSSVKGMMDILDILEDAHGKGHAVQVNWYYENDNARIAELAEEFKEDCTFPFEIIENKA
jgi:hypothetical protein